MEDGEFVGDGDEMRAADDERRVWLLNSEDQGSCWTDGTGKVVAEVVLVDTHKHGHTHTLST